MRFLVGICSLLLACSLTRSSGQIRIEVIRHPQFSLSDSSIFISGTFNGWSPGHPDFKLTRQSDGIYFFELPDTLTYFEYKFTQGGWALVEGLKNGGVMPNRVYNRALLSNPKLVQVEIAAWETQPAYTIIVKKIPGNTPHDASIYIMGDFNNWNPADKSYRLNKQIDGTFRVIIYSPEDEVQFKFTRGTEESLECRPGGIFLPNRILSRQKTMETSKIDYEISGWMDITDGSQLYSIYNLILLFSFFQGLMLIITIPGIQGYNRSANQWLLILIGFASFIVFLKVMSIYPAVFRVNPKLQLLPDFIFFIYSPLFYFYIHRLLFQSQGLYASRVPFHFIPALIQFFIYMGYLSMDASQFESKLSYLYSDLYIVRFVVAGVAVIVNFYYWMASQRALESYKQDYKNSHSYEQNLQYLNAVLFIQGICLIAWAATMVVAVSGRWWNLDTINIVEFSNQTIWMVFSMITFFLGYFAIHEPDIFRVPELVIKSSVQDPLALSNLPRVSSPLNGARDTEPIENFEAEVQQVKAYMDKFKPYTNPKLTLVELSSRLNQPPYLLSRIINVGFNKNFFDFVNSYRIEEFKKRVDDPRFRNHTLLSIAFDVGFNSKTAFNRSFKKITTETPSAYFNHNHIREY